jgi:hypothetical protein
MSNNTCRCPHCGTGVAVVAVGERLALVRTTVTPDGALRPLDPALEIIRRASLLFGLAHDVLRSPLRSKSINYARAITMYALRERLRMSLPELGRMFGRDHTTVMHALRKIRELILAGGDLGAEAAGHVAALVQPGTWLRKAVAVALDGGGVATGQSCGTCERCVAGMYEKCFALPCAGCGCVGFCNCEPTAETVMVG